MHDRRIILLHVLSVQLDCSFPDTENKVPKWEVLQLILMVSCYVMHRPMHNSNDSIHPVLSLVIVPISSILLSPWVYHHLDPEALIAPVSAIGVARNSRISGVA